MESHNTPFPYICVVCNVYRVCETCNIRHTMHIHIRNEETGIEVARCGVVSRAKVVLHFCCCRGHFLLTTFYVLLYMYTLYFLYVIMKAFLLYFAVSVRCIAEVQFRGKYRKWNLEKKCNSNDFMLNIKFSYYEKKPFHFYSLAVYLFLSRANI